MHKNNIHKSDYNFESLCKVHPELKDFVFENKHQSLSVDFANPKAVKTLNRALLQTYYNIKFWEFPEENLCPPIPGRVDYIHYLADLLELSGIDKNVSVIDIGTGASCIYPLLGHAVYDWSFIATDIDKTSLEYAQQIVDKNNFNKSIELKHQPDASQILNRILNAGEHISACMCNPPFYKSKDEAQDVTARKLKGLGNSTNKGTRNFSGTANELWYTGGEKAFLHNYLYESSLFKSQCYWYTTLVSKKENVKSMLSSLNKLGATAIKTIPMNQGQKISRIIAWTFLTEDEQKQWRDKF